MTQIRQDSNVELNIKVKVPYELRGKRHDMYFEVRNRLDSFFKEYHVTECGSDVPQDWSDPIGCNIILTEKEDE